MTPVTGPVNKPKKRIRSRFFLAGFLAECGVEP
jgi:hypothetical protein